VRISTQKNPEAKIHRSLIKYQIRKRQYH